MRELQPEDLYEAGWLIRYGLRPRERASNIDYARLLTRFHDEPFFREAVENIARGLGLSVVEGSELGLILAPLSDGPFVLRSEDLLGQNKDEKLLYGLIYLATFAAVFPQGADLADNARNARRAVTVDEVEKSLRTLCDKLAAEAKSIGGQDITVQEEQNELYGAWRVFHARQAAAESTDGSGQRKTTTALIRRALDYLTEHGCFNQSKNTFVPTYRFVVLVKEWSAQPLYEVVRKVQSSSTPVPVQTTSGLEE